MYGERCGVERGMVRCAHAYMYVCGESGRERMRHRDADVWCGVLHKCLYIGCA